MERQESRSPDPDRSPRREVDSEARAWGTLRDPGQTPENSTLGSTPRGLRVSGKACSGPKAASGSKQPLAELSWVVQGLEPFGGRVRHGVQDLEWRGDHGRRGAFIPGTTGSEGQAVHCVHFPMIKRV